MQTAQQLTHAHFMIAPVPTLPLQPTLLTLPITLLEEGLLSTSHTVWTPLIWFQLLFILLASRMKNEEKYKFSR